MAQPIKRAQFVWLTISFGVLGGVGACADDDDAVSPGAAGSGGLGNGSAGAGTAGAAGNNTGNPGTGAPASGSNAGGAAAEAGRGTVEGGAGSSASAGEGGLRATGGEASLNAGGTAGVGDAGGNASQGGAAAEAGAGGYGGGAAGADAGAGGVGGVPPVGPQCGQASMTQTATTGNGHSHITQEGETSLRFWLNSAHPTAEFELPATDHTHFIQLTRPEVDVLLAGGEVSGKITTESLSHTHTYTIACV